ncbi:MAG: tetratricopeptide repeat protein [Isosphaeraceae bacterium]
MKALRVAFRLGLLLGLGLAMPVMPTMAQTTPPKGDQPPAPGLIKLTGDDEKRAKQLEEPIDKALKADRWDEAIARAEELVTLRKRDQGAKHFETVDAEWRLKTLRRVASMTDQDRAAYRSAATMNEQGEGLFARGKYAASQQLFEKALEIRRRLLGDDHPDSVRSYNDLALSLTSQGRYALAQPLLEKVLEIERRLLADNSPVTAQGYNNLAYVIFLQGKHAQEICRRTLTDDHPYTAKGYGSLARNLHAQGKDARAQPLYEKSLEIHRRLLTDNHPDTALSYNTIAANLYGQGKYIEAKDRLRSAVDCFDKARLRVAFTGLEPAGTNESPRPIFAAVLARLGQPAEAWQSLAEDLGRGLLDELASRRDGRLVSAERARLRELTAALEGLDKLVEALPRDSTRPSGPSDSTT